MRFRKGGKVEVFSLKEVPSGSWRCAEIVRGNGHYYTVKYDEDVAGGGEVMIERVPRRVIRPCPPIKVLESWLPGDVVEVLHDYSWKMAIVVEVACEDWVLVRLLGSSLEFEVSKYDVRARVCWQDGQWIMIGKVSNDSKDSRKNVAPALMYNQNLGMETGVNRHLRNDSMTRKSFNGVQESQALPARTLKRKFPFYQLRNEAYEGHGRKITVTAKELRSLQFISKLKPSSPEKVEAVASSRKRMGEKSMHASCNNRITGCSDMIFEREIKDDAVGCSHAIGLESSDAHSVSSSVGSCSVSRNYPVRLSYAFPKGSLEDNDSSDAESFCWSRPDEGNCLLPPTEKLSEEIHRLELHAYRRTIQALHASGPLSWEHETLLTNLRDSLHISNDEHLMELRNLVPNSAYC